MQFSPWVLFTDFAFLSVLLLVGQLARNYIPLLQKYMLPASLTAGFLGLAFGPNGLGYIPLSSQLGTYSSILIVMVFAALPISSRVTDAKAFGREVGEMWSYVTFGCLAQYRWAMLLSIFVFGLIWQLHPGFGYMLATGFFGGHGTAAAVGASFKPYDWPDATSLAMTSATVGVIASVIGGLILVNYGARRGYTREVSSPDKLIDNEMLTGMIPPEKQKPIGKETTSGESLESLTFHLSLIMLAAIAGRYGTILFDKIIPSVSVPEFCIALFAGYVIQWVLSRTGGQKYVDSASINRLSNLATDYLIVAGIASIKLPIVIQYAGPLSALFATGIALVLFQAIWMGPRQFKDRWFEKSMFCYGFNTGTLVNGVMLLRIIDPNMKSRSMETYAVVGLVDRPMIIALIALGPALIGTGYAVHFALACSVLAIVPLVLSKLFGWWHPDQRMVGGAVGEAVGEVVAETKAN
jgi:ESS family glutamate:Na+ symporter